MRRNTVVGLVAGMLLIAVGCSGPDPWVARVANERIRLSELVDSYKAGKPQNVLQLVNAEKLRAHLDRMIDDRLMLLEAYRQGLDRDPSVVAQLQREEKKRLYDLVIDQQVVERAIPESERREFYSHLGVEVRVRHLFLALPAKPSEEEERAVLQKIKNLRARLDEGADFQELVKKYSQDTETVPDGGDLGWISWSPNPIQRTAFALEPGQVSGPVRSRLGYHLVKVEEKRSVRVPPFAEMDRQIKTTLRRLKNREVSAAGEEFIAELMQRYRFTYLKENIERVAARLAPADSARKKRTLIPIDSLLTPEDLGLVLAKYDGGEIRARELAIYRRYPTRVRQIRDWITRKMRRDLVVLEGYRLGLHKSPEFQVRLKTFKDDLLRQEIEERQVNRRVDAMPQVTPTSKNLAEINIQAQEIRSQRQARLRAWLQELRQRYPISIHEQRLEAAVEEIRGGGE